MVTIVVILTSINVFMHYSVQNHNITLKNTADVPNGILYRSMFGCCGPFVFISKKIAITGSTLHIFINVFIWRRQIPHFWKVEEIMQLRHIVIFQVMMVSESGFRRNKGLENGSLENFFINTMHFPLLVWRPGGNLM